MKKLFCILLIAVLCLGGLTAFAADGEYASWRQSDSRWGSVTFGQQGDTLSKSGCAITSVAKLMVHSGAVADDTSVFNPGILTAFLNNNGGITSQGWLVWSKVDLYTPAFSYQGAADLSGTPAEKTAAIRSYINSGCVVVVMVKNGGHYVAVDRVENDTVYIMDPADTGYTKLFQYAAAGVTKIQLYRGPRTRPPTTPTAPAQYDTTVDPVGAGTYVIRSDNGVNLRAGPSTSDAILTAIPNKASVRVTKVKDGWGYTSYNGKQGWFSLQYADTTVTLRGLKVTPPKKTVYRQKESLDLTGMTVTALYSDGTQKKLTAGYTVTSLPDNALGECPVYVTYQTKSATFTVTVEKSSVAYAAGAYTVKSSNGLHLRAGPSTGDTSLAVVPDQTSLTVSQVNGNWGKTVYAGKTGWVCLDYTAFAGTAPGTTTDLLPGDCDGSGRVDASDALLVLRHTVGKPVELNAQAADMNKDGDITVTDALLILRHAVGK